MPASLLDLDPTLATVIGIGHPAITRPVFTVTAPSSGKWMPDGARFAVLDGLLQRDDEDLFGPGDLLGTGAWTAGDGVRLAVIGEAFDALVREWPQLQARVAARAARQDAWRGALRAAAAVSDPQERVLAVLWTLAARWGRLSGGGIALVPVLGLVPLGRLVSLSRPQLDAALRDLDAQRQPGGRWVLGRRSRHAGGMLRLRDDLRVRLAEQLSASRGAQRETLAVFGRLNEERLGSLR